MDIKYIFGYFLICQEEFVVIIIALLHFRSLIQHGYVFF